MLKDCPKPAMQALKKVDCSDLYWSPCMKYHNVLIWLSLTARIRIKKTFVGAERSLQQQFGDIWIVSIRAAWSPCMKNNNIRIWLFMVAQIQAKKTFLNAGCGVQ